MTPVIALIAVLAGGLASAARYAVSLAFAGRSALPVAVLIVNIVGSSIGGAVLALAEASVIDQGMRLVLLGGVAGGLTTFSTFSVETMQLVESGRWRSAVASAGANIVLGVGVATGSWAITGALLG